MQNEAWGRLIETLRSKGLEIAESAILASFEPCALSSCYEDELRRALRAFEGARDGELIRLRPFVNRNAFLIACGNYTENKREEHLVVGYGRRYGSTTRVASLHHVLGAADSVAVPAHVAHTMWDYYRQNPAHELLVFHNHPFNPLNLILDNGPLASRADRIAMQERSFNIEQVLRTFRGEGRVLFYLGENGSVKQFRLPSVLGRLIIGAHEHH